MVAFIDDHKSAFGVESICRHLPIAPSTQHRAGGRDSSRPTARPPAILVLHAKTVPDEHP